MWALVVSKHIYVDDNAMIGEKTAIEVTYSQIQEHFNVTMDDMTNYVWFHYIKTLDGIKLQQPILLQKMKNIFRE